MLHLGRRIASDIGRCRGCRTGSATGLARPPCTASAIARCLRAHTVVQPLTTLTHVPGDASWRSAVATTLREASPPSSHINHGHHLAATARLRGIHTTATALGGRRDGNASGIPERVKKWRKHLSKKARKRHKRAKEKAQRHNAPGSMVAIRKRTSAPLPTGPAAVGLDELKARTKLVVDLITYKKPPTVSPQQALRAQDADAIGDAMAEGRTPVSLSSYNYLLRVLGAQARFADCMQVVASMRSNDIDPDERTYTALMTLCGNVQNPEAAWDLLDTMREAGIAPSVATYGALMRACVRSGQLAAAFSVLPLVEAEGLEPGPVLFTQLIVGCIDEGRLEQAWATFDHMRQLHCEPDAVAFTAMITACARADEVERAHNLFVEMQQIGASPTHVTYNAMIHAAARSFRRHELAHEVFDEMDSRGFAHDVRSYNAVLLACSHKGEVLRAKAYMRRMLQAGLTPDLFTYNTMLTVYARSMTRMSGSAVVPAWEDGDHLLGPAPPPHEGADIGVGQVAVVGDDEDVSEKLLMDFYNRDLKKDYRDDHEDYVEDPAERAKAEVDEEFAADEAMAAAVKDRLYAKLGISSGDDDDAEIEAIEAQIEALKGQAEAHSGRSAGGGAAGTHTGARAGAGADVRDGTDVDVEVNGDIDAKTLLHELEAQLAGVDALAEGAASRELGVADLSELSELEEEESARLVAGYLERLLGAAEDSDASEVPIGMVPALAAGNIAADGSGGGGDGATLISGSGAVTAARDVGATTPGAGSRESASVNTELAIDDDGGYSAEADRDTSESDDGDSAETDGVTAVALPGAVRPGFVRRRRAGYLSPAVKVAAQEAERQFREAAAAEPTDSDEAAALDGTDAHSPRGLPPGRASVGNTSPAARLSSSGGAWSGGVAADAASAVAALRGPYAASANVGAAAAAARSPGEPTFGSTLVSSVLDGGEVVLPDSADGYQADNAYNSDEGRPRAAVPDPAVRQRALADLGKRLMAGAMWIDEVLPADPNVARNRLLREAENVYELLQEEGHTPDAVTLNAMVLAYADAQRERDANRFIRHEFARLRLAPDERTYRALIRMYLKTGKTDTAVAVKDAMVSAGVAPSKDSLGLLVHGLAKEDRLREAFGVLEDMARRDMVCPERHAFLLREKCKERRVRHPLVPDHPLAPQFTPRIMKMRKAVDWATNKAVNLIKHASFEHSRTN